MWFIFVATILVCSSVHCCWGQQVALSDAGFEVRDRGRMRSVVDDAILKRELLLVFTSRNEAVDDYSELYIGWLQHLFSSRRFKTKVVMLNVDVSRPREDYTADVDYFLGILPEEAIFVVFDHNPPEMDVRSLGYLGRIKAQARPCTNDTVVLEYYHPVRNFGVFHLNHEQPWNFQGGSWNVHYFSEEMLRDLSSAHGLLFRNYFHAPLEGLPTVVQLPLGPAYYGFRGAFLGPNSTLPVRQPTSSRPIRCRFIGRQTYGRRNLDSVPERADFVALARRVPFEVAMRVNDTHVIGWRPEYCSAEDAALPCEAVDSLQQSRRAGYLSAYATSLAHTRFAPCPPGNNPETFRHYEALEAGAIPLILSSPHHSLFLASKYWRDYPGPLFVNWQEAGAFVRNVTDSVADRLQSQLRVWYEGMKAQMRRDVEAAVLRRHPGLDLDLDLDLDDDGGGEEKYSAAAGAAGRIVAANVSEQESFCRDRSCVVSRVAVGGASLPLVIHRAHRPEDAVADFMREHGANPALERVVLTQLCQQIAELGPQSVVRACDGLPPRALLLAMKYPGWMHSFLPIRRGYGLAHYTAMLSAAAGERRLSGQQRRVKGLQVAQGLFAQLVREFPAVEQDPGRGALRADMFELFGELLFPLSRYAYRRSKLEAPIDLAGVRQSLFILQDQRPEDAVADFILQLPPPQQVSTLYTELLAALCPQVAQSAPEAVQCRPEQNGGLAPPREVLYLLDIGLSDIPVRAGYSVEFYTYLACERLRCDVERQRAVEDSLRALGAVTWADNSRGAPRRGLRDVGEAVAVAAEDAASDVSSTRPRREPTLGHMPVSFALRNGSLGSDIVKLYANMRPEDAVADFLLLHGAEVDDEAELRAQILNYLCPTINRRRSTSLHLLECDRRESRRLLLSVNVSSVLPAECRERPLVRVRIGYSVVALRSWVGDQLWCRGDNGNPRAYLSPEVVTAAEVAVMRAVWGLLSDAEGLLALVQDYSWAELALLGRLYDSVGLGAQRPMPAGEQEPGPLNQAPSGGGVGAERQYGLHRGCLAPLGGSDPAAYAVLCRHSTVVLLAHVSVPPLDRPAEADPGPAAALLPLVLFSEQRLADAAADFLFQHRQIIADKEVLFQGVLDRLCPLLTQASAALAHTGKTVLLCDGDFSKSPLVVSVRLEGSAAAPLPPGALEYPWLHMRTRYPVAFYASAVCAQLACGALQQVLVESVVEREYRQALALRNEQYARCNLTSRVELLGEPTRMEPLYYKKYKIDLSNNVLQLFTVSYRNVAAQVCAAYRPTLGDPPEVCIPAITRSLTAQFDGVPLDADGSAYARLVERFRPERARVAFITAIYGGYDTGCKAFVPQTQRADFICFSDDAAIAANGWEVDTTPHHLLNPSPLDDGSMLNSMSRNNHTFNVAKYYKQAFHNIPRLQDYDIVVWMDGSLQLTEARAAEQVSLLVAERGCAVGVWNHTIRRALSEEVAVTKDFYRYCATHFSDQDQPYQDIAGQFRAYQQELPGVDSVGVWYTTFMINDMKSPATRLLLDRWYLETLKHTTNDQISFPYAVLASGMLDALCTLPSAVIRGQYPNHQTSLYQKNDHSMPL